MTAAIVRRRLGRAASNAENLVPRAKQTPYKAARRLTPCNPLRESSLRRRNRVLSGLLSAPAPAASIVAHVKRQRLATSAKPSVSVTLPTPPTTPGTATAELEIADVEMADDVSVPQRAEGSHTLRIPRTLRRPPSIAIPQAVVQAVDPEALDGVPAPYVRDALQSLAPEMFKVAASVKMLSPKFTVPPGRGLPKELAIIVHDLSAELPSHLLAVQALAKPGRTLPPSTRAKVELYPIHHLVLATQCARLALPPSSRAAATSSGSQVTLPVVPIALPHPESFPLLHHWLYHHDAQAFLAWLLPRLPGQAAAADPMRLAAALADTFTPQLVLRHLMKVFGVYTNVCVLGIQDDRLWGLLNVAWEVLALTAATCARNMQTHTQA